MDAVKEASPAQEQTVAATIQPLREGSFARAPLVDANSVKTKRAKRESSNTIFDLAVSLPGRSSWQLGSSATVLATDLQKSRQRFIPCFFFT